MILSCAWKSSQPFLLDSFKSWSWELRLESAVHWGTVIIYWQHTRLLRGVDVYCIDRILTSARESRHNLFLLDAFKSWSWELRLEIGGFYAILTVFSQQFCLPTSNPIQYCLLPFTRPCILIPKQCITMVQLNVLQSTSSFHSLNELFQECQILYVPCQKIWSFLLCFKSVKCCSPCYSDPLYLLLALMWTLVLWDCPLSTKAHLCSGSIQRLELRA
jgi:hypothetical protein